MASIFDTTPLPTMSEQLADEMARQSVAADIAAYRQKMQDERGNWFTSGVSSGIDQFQALSGRGIQAAGDALQSPTISQFGAGIAERNFAEAAANGRPDLEERPSLENWTQYPAWLGYQAAKQLPNIAASLVAARFGGAKLASMIPQAAAATTLGRMAAGAAAAAPVMYPQAAGSLYNEAVEAGTAGPKTAGQALLGAIPYSLMEGFQPAALERQLAKGLAGDFLRRVSTAAAVNAATEGVTEGVQTAMEQSFRPDLTPQDKFNNIVEGAVTGAAVGGLFGAFGGIRKLKNVDASTVNTDDLKSEIDANLRRETPMVDANNTVTKGGEQAQRDLMLRTTEEQAPRRVGQDVYDLRTRELRPFAGPETAELQQRLAEVEQRGLVTSQMAKQVPGMAPVGAAKQDMVLAQLLRQELDRRAQERGATPVAADPGREALQAEPRLNDPNQPQTMEMFPEQRSPKLPPTPDAAAQIAARAKAQARSVELLGRSKAQEAKAIMQMPAADDIDVDANIVMAVNSRDEVGRNLPDFVKKAAQKIGIMDAQGRPRDIQAELVQAQARNEQLWEKVRTTQEGEGQARAQQRKVNKLKAVAQRLDAVQQRVAQRTEQATPVNEETRPSTPEETVATLQAAPALAPTPTFDQRFRQRGTLDANTQIAEEAAPAPVRNASGEQYVSLEQRLRGQVPREMMADVPAAISPEARVAAALGIATTPEAPTQYVTAQDRAKAKRSRKKVDVATPVIPTAPLAQGGSFSAAAPVTPTSATDIQPGSQRDQFVRQAGATKLERIAADESLPQDLQYLRSAALEARKDYSNGKFDTMDAVLAEYAERTNDIVFSNRPLSEAQPPLSDSRFDEALVNIANTLPQSAREVIYPVRTASDLPNAVLIAAEKKGMHPGEIRGVLYDGKVYVVQDQVSSEAELKEVIDHEVFGHGGARALLGDQRNAIMARVFKMIGGLEGLRSLARYYNVEKALNGYLPGRDLTDADQVALTDEILAQAAGKATGQMKIMALAWVSRFKSALINVLRDLGLNTLAERLNTFSPADMAEMLVRMREAVEAGTPLSGIDPATGKPLAGPSIDFLRTTPKGMVEDTKKLISASASFKKMMDSNVAKTSGLNANRFHLYTSTVGHIVEYYKHLFETTDASGRVRNWLVEYFDSNIARGVTEQRLAHMVKKVYTAYETLEKNDSKMAKAVRDLMGYTFFEIDPRKSWSEQTWLHSARNADVLRQHANDANNLYRRLNEPNNKLGNEALAVYRDFINVNEAFHLAQQAVSLYNIMATDDGVAQAVKDRLQNPMDKFLADPTTYDDAAATRAFWLKEANDLATFAKQYIAEQRGLAEASDAVMRDKISRSTSAIFARVVEMENEQKGMLQAPYFHIGRFGPHVLSFHLKTMENGDPDPIALERTAAALEKAGITGIEIPRTGAERANVFIRFEKLSERDAARAVVENLHKQGYVVVDGDKKKILSFNRDDEVFSVDMMKQAPGWASRLIDHLKTTPLGGGVDIPGMDAKTKAAISNEFIKNVQEFFLNSLPDTAINKVMVHRDAVPGFSSDMIRSYLFRTQVGGRALANLYASAKMSEATAGMSQVARDARADSDTKTAQIKQNVVTELFKREAERPMLVKGDWVDTLRALNHAYFLGLSPSYVAVNMTQLGVLLWPELAKRYSFVKSAKTIGKVTPLAFKIMKAAITDAGKLGIKHLPDASITRQSLKEAGVDQKTADFVMRVVNSGLLDIGSQSRELGRIVEGSQDSKLEQGLRWASSAGYYSEMVSRLIAALAARDLHGDDGTVAGQEAMHKYVATTVRQSMLSYETWNQARATGKMGRAGSLTPIMTSFMQYTFQLTEKLYRELFDAFKGDTPEQRKAARSFLIAHLGAVTTLTGTLGLPMAAVFAGVFDRVADMFGDDDDEPTNIQAAYRNWLADVFGKDVGEMLARGVPRGLPFGLGFDISSRAGEQNLLPYGHMFTKLITDRRKWEDVVSDWALDTMGSPVSMISNIIQGGGHLMSGDVEKSAETMLPLALRGLAKAYKLTSDGYVDNKGNKMPMTPGAGEILMQALGFNPAPKAEYTEERGVQQTLKGERYRTATQLRKRIVVAIEKGDMAAAREAIREAQKWDAANPQFDVLPRIGATLRSRAKERALARATGSPLGVSPELSDRTRFGNY